MYAFLKRKDIVNTHTLILALIILFSFFLRFYRIEENFIFHGEIGHNYLEIKEYYLNKQVPLIGPPTSHPWLYFGPYFYWIFGPILILGNFNPVVGVYFFGLVSLLVILVNYFVINNLAGRRLALITSFLISFSPVWIWLAREARFFSITALLFYPFIYFLTNSIREYPRIYAGDESNADISSSFRGNTALKSGEDVIKSFTRKQKHAFFAGVFLGFMLNFHYSSLIVIPSLLLVFYKAKKRIIKISLFLIGVLITLIPIVIYDFQNGFGMLTKLLLWVPYRILGSLGVIPKNNASISTIINNLISMGNFIRMNFIAPEGNIVAILALVAVALGILLILTRKKRKHLSFGYVAVTIFLLSYVALFIHSDFPIHYYLPVFPIPIIIVGLLLDKLIENNIWKYFVGLVMLLVLAINLQFYFSRQWLYRKGEDFTKIDIVPYSTQLSVVEYIVNDVEGEDFSINRVGPFDEFEGDYAQNYIYLMWLMGNEPIKEAKINYTIYENIDKIPDISKEKVKNIDSVAVLKDVKL